MELRMYYVTSATDCILVTLIISLCSIQYHSRFAAGKLIERGTFLTDWLDDFILKYNVCIMQCTGDAHYGRVADQYYSRFAAV